MKKILILGANFPQTLVINKAKELGYHTIAISNDPSSLGFQYADEYALVDITDWEACLQFAKEKQIDGIMSPATDTGVLAGAYVAQELGLSGISLPAAQLIKNKHAVRKLFAEHQIDNVKQYYQVKSLHDLAAIAPNIQFPVMVKPTDGSASKGARRVDSVEDLPAACEAAFQVSHSKEALIEDFIVGKEYGVESFVYRGEVYVLGILNKEMTAPPDYAELGHMIPSGLTIETEVKEVVTNAINILGVDFGSVNMDILVTEENKICIIDIGARMGGNLIGSHIIEQATGFPYMENAIKAAVQDEINLPQNESKKSVATKLLALTPGTILSLPNFDTIKKQHQVELYFFKAVGATIAEYHNNTDACGFILSVGDEVGEVEERAKKAKDHIERAIVRSPVFGIETRPLIVTKSN